MNQKLIHSAGSETYLTRFEFRTCQQHSKQCEFDRFHQSLLKPINQVRNCISSSSLCAKCTERNDIISQFKSNQIVDCESYIYQIASEFRAVFVCVELCRQLNS